MGHQIILLDEPTNDLDLLTLRVLEDALLGFDGAVLLVSHDRAFVDRVATEVLSFEPNGGVMRYASRLQAVAAAQRQVQPKGKPTAKPKAKGRNAPTTARSSRDKGLSYKERKELKGLPALLEQAEAEQASIEASLADPATYKRGTDAVQSLNDGLVRASAAVAVLYQRWEDLEARA